MKKVQAEKREKAAETRPKRKATAVRSIKLLPSEASQLVTTRTGNLALKGEFKIIDAGGPMMSLEITQLNEKSLKKLGFEHIALCRTDEPEHRHFSTTSTRSKRHVWRHPACASCEPGCLGLNVDL